METTMTVQLNDLLLIIADLFLFLLVIRAYVPR